MDTYINKHGLATPMATKPSNGMTQMTGNVNEPIPSGRTSLHPTRSVAKRLVGMASMDDRYMEMPKVQTDKFKG